MGIGLSATMETASVFIQMATASSISVRLRQMRYQNAREEMPVLYQYLNSVRVLIIEQRAPRKKWIFSFCDVFSSKITALTKFKK